MFGNLLTSNTNTDNRHIVKALRVAHEYCKPYMPWLPCPRVFEIISVVPTKVDHQEQLRPDEAYGPVWVWVIVLDSVAETASDSSSGTWSQLQCNWKIVNTGDTKNT